MSNIPFPAVIFGAVVVFIILAVVLGGRFEKKRVLALRAKLSELGLTPAQTASEFDKAQAFEPFVAMSELLKTGAKGLAWAGSGVRSRRRIVAIEHSYTTGSGKNRTTHRNTLVATPCPPDWARVVITREHLFTRLGKVFGMKDLDLEHERFNKLWRVSTQDENFALALLGPSVQEFLAAPNRPDMSEQWRCGGGLICVIHAHQVSPEKLAALVERLEGLLGALEPELANLLPAA